jgi:hypothetical protein
MSNELSMCICMQRTLTDALNVGPRVKPDFALLYTVRIHFKKSKILIRMTHLILINLEHSFQDGGSTCFHTFVKALAQTSKVRHLKTTACTNREYDLNAI